MAETETRCLPIIDEEEIDEDFYEKIEAPKFVDLTAPDHRRSHDDRHWFCLRVGILHYHYNLIPFSSHFQLHLHCKQFRF